MNQFSFVFLHDKWLLKSDISGIPEFHCQSIDVFESVIQEFYPNNPQKFLQFVTEILAELISQLDLVKSSKKHPMSVPQRYSLTWWLGAISLNLLNKLMINPE